MTKQTGGSFYLKKLFGFGLETKLSYTVLAEKNSPDYEYSSGYFANGGSTIEERNESMDSLIRTGVRSKNDILAMQVNVNENRRQLQDAKIQYSKAKMELVTSLGLADSSLIGEPENSFSQIDLTSITPPNDSDLNDDFFAKIEEKRPDLKSLKKQVEAASKKVRMYQVDSLPDASLNFAIGTTGAAYSDDLGKTLSSGFKNIRGTNISGSLGVSANLGNNIKKAFRNRLRQNIEQA
ncbi:hypothetical protein [uncultured Treponema sp.]|uniref:TolC family protein n=1 Tax=uncultured Treponema sp. TaxID=162155 RepID=UPI0025CBCA27|nr:hypothetical protein [uncultured Treponema sp.]